MKNNRGLSLIAVLWIVTILTVLASEFMYSLQLEIKTSRNWNDQINAYYSAKGGFETAIAYLKSDETSYDSLDEDWANGFTGELNNTNFNAKMIDESAMININTIDEATLTKVIQYVLTNQVSTQDLAEAELTAQAQELATAIVAKRPFKTASEMSKTEGMTPEILYGWTGEVDITQQDNTSSTGTEEQQNTIALLDVTTVFSADKNISSDGSKRVNINSADASQIQQGVNGQQGQGQSQGQQQNQQQVITQQEAQAIVDYRSQSSNQGNQQAGGQTAGQTGQTGQMGGQAGQTAGQQTGQTAQQGANQTYKAITDLLNVPAVSQATLDAIRDRISVDDQQQQGNQQQGGNQQQQKVNINTASADQLRNLNNAIDDGIAQSIVSYRQNNRFNSVDDLKQVKVVSIQDLKTIADKVTTTDDVVLQGKINLNTVPLELLQILPGMDETKANAIIAYRESGTATTSSSKTSSAASQSGNQQGGPFDDIGKLLDVQGIDQNTFRQLVDIAAYRSSVFRIESTGTSQDNKIKNGFTAIIDRSGDRITIKYWKELYGSSKK
jgi:DNA uptake protein ComE-like DNA-binding protein